MSRGLLRTVCQYMCTVTVYRVEKFSSVFVPKSTLRSKFYDFYLSQNFVTLGYDTSGLYSHSTQVG